jgi:hypothetical protein
MNSVGNLKSTQLRTLLKKFKSTVMQSLRIFGAMEGVCLNLQVPTDFEFWIKASDWVGPTRQCPRLDRVPGVQTAAEAILSEPIIFLRCPRARRHPYPLPWTPRVLHFCFPRTRVHRCSHSLPLGSHSRSLLCSLPCAAVAIKGPMPQPPLSPRRPLL